MPKFLDVTNKSVARNYIEAANRNSAFFSAGGLANGAFPSTGELDSGHPYVVTSSGNQGFTITNEALQSTSSLAYLNFGPLPGPVQELWVEVSWTDNGHATDENVCIVVSEDEFANGYPGSNPYTGYSNAGSHMLLYRNQVVYQKRKGDGSATTLMLDYDFPTDLPFDTRHRFGLLWDGRQVTVVMPGRETYTIAYDSDIVDWWGPYGCVEILGSSTGKNKIRVHSFNYSTESKPIVQPERGITSIGTPGLASAAQSTSFKSPGTTTTTLAATYTTVLTKTFRVPPTKAVSVVATVPVSVSDDGNLSGQLSAGGNPTSVVSTTLLEAQAHVGMVTLAGVLDLSEFNVGANFTLWVRLAHNGTGTYRTSTSGPPRVPSVLITEAIGSYS